MGANSRTTTGPRSASFIIPVVKWLPAVLIAVAVVWLWVAGDGRVRPSADSPATIPVWHLWVAPAVGIVALMLTPHLAPRHQRSPLAPPRSAGGKTLVLVALAIAFVITMAVANTLEPANFGPVYLVSKIVLLVLVPLLILRGTRSTFIPSPRHLQRVGARPLVPITCWFLIAYATPLTPQLDAAQTELADDLATLAIVLIVGFVLNAVIEEVFYRRWLQTRVESVLGRTSGILWATVLWALWHIGLQSVGRLDLDLSAVLAGHAMTGIFLGMLWSRYRTMWPILLVHGLLNATLLLIAAL